MKKNELLDFLEIVSPVLVSIGGFCTGFGGMRLLDASLNSAALPVFIVGVSLILVDIILWIIAGRVDKKLGNR